MKTDFLYIQSNNFERENSMKTLFDSSILYGHGNIDY